MRRLLVLLSPFLFIFLFVACAPSEIKPVDINFAFHCKADILCSGEQVTCDLSHTAPKMASIQILSGDLNGLSYYWSGEDFTISYCGLSAKSDDCVLPQSSFAWVLLQALDYAQQGGTLIRTHGNEFSGSTNGTDFTITVDNKTGQIQTMSIPHNKLTINLYDYTEQGL